MIFLLAAISCKQKPQTATEKAVADTGITASRLDTIDHPLTELVTAKHSTLNDGIEDLPASLMQFVPNGFSVLDTAMGNLNLDAYEDVVMVLRKNGEDTTSDVGEHPEKRPLLLLTGQDDHSFKLAARSDNAVYCIDCGGAMGDPYMEVVIKNGYFSVEHYGGSSWRWTRVITFKYSPSDSSWYLHKDGGDSFHATEDPNKVTSKVRTTKDFGKVPFAQFDIYKED